MGSGKILEAQINSYDTNPLTIIIFGCVHFICFVSSLHFFYFILLI